MSFWRTIRERRELLWNLTARELKQRYKDSTLGFLWSVLTPLFMAAIYVVFLRLLAAQSQTNMKDLQSGRASGRMERVLKARDELVQMPLFICDRGGLSLAQLTAQARRMVHQHGIKLLIVDYLGVAEELKEAVAQYTILRV